MAGALVTYKTLSWASGIATAFHANAVKDAGIGYKFATLGLNRYNKALKVSVVWLKRAAKVASRNPLGIAITLATTAYSMYSISQDSVMENQLKEIENQKKITEEIEKTTKAAKNLGQYEQYKAKVTATQASIAADKKALKDLQETVRIMKGRDAKKDLRDTLGVGPQGGITGKYTMQEAMIKELQDRIKKANEDLGSLVKEEPGRKLRAHLFIDNEEIQRISKATALWGKLPKGSAEYYKYATAITATIDKDIEKNAKLLDLNITRNDVHKQEIINAKTSADLLEAKLKIMGTLNAAEEKFSAMSTAKQQGKSGQELSNFINVLKDELKYTDKSLTLFNEKEAIQKSINDNAKREANQRKQEFNNIISLWSKVVAGSAEYYEFADKLTDALDVEIQKNERILDQKVKGAGIYKQELKDAKTSADILNTTLDIQLRLRQEQEAYGALSAKAQRGAEGQAIQARITILRDENTIAQNILDITRKQEGIQGSITKYKDQEEGHMRNLQGLRLRHAKLDEKRLANETAYGEIISRYRDRFSEVNQIQIDGQKKI
jgi:hypothetical protein